MRPQKQTYYRRIIIAAGVLCLVYLLLFIPESDAPGTVAVNRPAESQPFAWKQDAFWRALEGEFQQTRELGCTSARERIISQLFFLNHMIDSLDDRNLPPQDAFYRDLEAALFETAPLVAACPQHLNAFSDAVNRMRMQMKRQSLRWDMTQSPSRITLYRLLYGGRAAVEEVMLQVPPQFALQPLMMGVDEPSQTPWASILGVKIHSGDMLVSRGGAATSALIARGNDFAGNFSHVALVYVHPKTHLASILESHIERGVTISSLQDYLQDIKLRVLVLRLRADLPAMAADPLLPHRAAERALERAQQQHIPYDFAMDFSDSSKLFCSEVASAAYRNLGIDLWMSLSQISSTGLRRWLAGFGVRHFTTQEPSDLEYDPQLQVVAEWRDLETLRKDHIDNAVTEILLDGAHIGEPLHYNRFLLPLARLAKTYSMILNAFGGVGPVPEGMSATSALRNQWYTSLHSRIKRRLEVQVQNFMNEQGYMPPYWRLVEMAQAIKSEFGQ